MEPPSDLEIVSLQKLKLQIQDLNLEQDYLEDKNLVRWLRARKHDLDNAEKMIRKSQEWCLNNNIDNLMDLYDVKWAEEFPVYTSGYHTLGGPVCVMEIGKWDLYKALAEGHKSEINQYVITAIELVWLIIKEQSVSRDSMTQFVSIYDLQGLSLRQVTSYDVLETTLQAARSFEANYPETIRNGFVLNAPWAFQIVWKAVRPIIDERTAAKLILLGSDPEIWREEISKVVPLDQFPERYGGTGPNNCPQLIEIYKGRRNNT